MILDELMSTWKHFSYRIKSRKKIFTDIYNNNGFSGKEHPMSGIGSSIEQTKIIRDILPNLFKKYNILSIIDAPCGDFIWMKEVDLNGINYVGYDIVKNVVDTNILNYGKCNILFDELDIVKQPPPCADLILCRDCFVHLSNRDVMKSLSNFKKSGTKYLLTTTFIGIDGNTDLVSGRGWRPINLQIPPYNFPPPLYLQIEECPEYSDKSLGLWITNDIPWLSQR